MNLSVSPEQLIEKGHQFISLSASFGEHNETLAGAVYGLKDAWQGSDYDAALQEYLKYQPGLTSIADFLKEFGNLLISTGEDYRARIDQNAARFNS